MLSKEERRKFKTAKRKSLSESGKIKEKFFESSETKLLSKLSGIIFKMKREKTERKSPSRIEEPNPTFDM